jgi:hypothetical protein
MDTAFVSDTGELVERVSTFEDDRSIRGIVILTAAETAPEPAEVDPTLRDLSVPVFGGVFTEILYEGEKYDTGAVVAGLSVEPSVTVVRGLSDEGTDVDAALPAYPGDATAFVLVDAYATRVEDFVGSLFNAYGVDVSYVGGGAGTLAEEGRPCLFTGEGLLADAAVFATVDSPTVSIVSTSTASYSERNSAGERSSAASKRPLSISAVGGPRISQCSPSVDRPTPVNRSAKPGSRSSTVTDQPCA